MLSLYKHILIIGSTGIGKTLSIDLMFNKKTYDIIYYEYGNLSHFFKNNNNKSVKNKEKVIVVDNIEELDIKEINQILKLNILNENIFIILICNNEYTNHKDLKIVKSYFHEFKFITPSIQEIFVFVKNICSKNSINITDNKINELIIQKQKDIRSIINEILFFKENINNTYINKKNIKQNIFDDFNEITKKIELQEKIIILEKTDCLDLMLHENYCNDKYTNIDNINKISGKISLCDTFNCKEIPDNYEIRKYLLLAFDNINIKGNIKFPSYFNNESKRKRKKDNLKDLYYNYKKKNINTTLSIEEFIEYNKKLKMI